MFVFDTILLAPIHATLWAARQIHNAIQQETEAAPEQLTAQLSELYMMVETGRITEEEFAAREKEVLDELDRLNEVEAPPNEEPAAMERPRVATGVRGRRRRRPPGSPTP